MALLEHPLVRIGEARGDWLDQGASLELGAARPAHRARARAAARGRREGGVRPWWSEVEATSPADDRWRGGAGGPTRLRCDRGGEALCGETLWAQADGRALSAFVDELRLHAPRSATRLDPAEWPAALREAMGASRASAVGAAPALWRSTGCSNRACDPRRAGDLRRAQRGPRWPATPATDPLLRAVLRALGCPAPTSASASPRTT
jgi:ATP-dependent helicase/nuclease subunit B